MLTRILTARKFKLKLQQSPWRLDGKVRRKDLREAQSEARDALEELSALRQQIYAAGLESLDESAASLSLEAVTNCFCCPWV